MALSAAEVGKFTTLEIGDTDAETPPVSWALVGEVIGEINVNTEREQLDVTSHGLSIWSDQISGRVTPISLTYTINSVHADIQVLWDIHKNTDPAGAGAWFRILYPFGYLHRYAANVAGLNTISPLDGAQITTEVTLGVRDEVFYEIND